LNNGDNNGDDAHAAAERLEQALERIAALAQRPAAAVANPADSTDQAGGLVDAGAVASRLDALIAELRGALAS